MLNVGRRRPGAEQVCLPLGDGSSRLSDPLHTDWIVVTSKILQILETNNKLPIDSDLMCHFAAHAAFEKARGAPQNENMSISLALKFKRILKNLFHNGLVSVQPSVHQTKTNCDWASMWFVLGQRSIGLHFLSEQPYFEVFDEPKGEAFTTETLATALSKARKEIAAEVVAKTIQSGNAATNAVAVNTSDVPTTDNEQPLPPPPKRPAPLPTSRAAPSQTVAPWLTGAPPIQRQQQQQQQQQQQTLYQRPVLSSANPDQGLIGSSQFSNANGSQVRFRSGMF